MKLVGHVWSSALTRDADNLSLLQKRAFKLPFGMNPSLGYFCRFSGQPSCFNPSRAHEELDATPISGLLMEPAVLGMLQTCAYVGQASRLLTTQRQITRKGIQVHRRRVAGVQVTAISRLR